MDYNKLKDEIINDPLSRYNGLTDEQIAASLNTVDRTKFVPVSSADLLAWSAQSSTGQDPRIRKVRETILDTRASVKPFRAIAEVAEILITRDSTALDLNKTDHVALVDALVAGSVLSTEDKTSLYDLATEPASRAEELGLPFVHPINVTEAKNI